MVYITTATEAEARTIGRTLVADRLAACANVLPRVYSVHHWEGDIRENEESVVLIKTRAELFSALEARVRELHSYQTPCIVALPLTQGHVPFLDWILEETKP